MNKPETVRARYRRNRARGLCTRCSKKARPGKGLCAHHAAYQAHIVATRSPSQKRQWRAAAAQRAKSAVFAAYGKQCACCREQREQFLTIDHVNGDGFKTRGLLGGTNLWKAVVREGCPAAYRVLCMNCNHAMGIWGTCPHGTLPPQKTNHPANRIQDDLTAT